MFNSMRVKTPSFTIPSISVRIDVVILLLLFILFTTCFTFQSCCKVGWTEGMANIKEGIQQVKEEIKKEKKNSCSV